jgi:glycosyltransferase involved in cell wall biosynthesis
VRVVVVCDWLLKYAAMQAAGLARAGAEVTLLCRDHAHEFGGDQGERATLLELAGQSNVRILELRGRLWDPRAAASLPALRRQLRRFAPHVTHAHEMADPRALAVLPPALRVLTVHDPNPHPGQEVLGRRLSRAVLTYPYQAWRRWAELVVVHSCALARQLHRRRGQAVCVVPHGLEVRDEPFDVPLARAVGFFGRHEPYKGLGVLAGAMPRVWSVRPEVRLRVAGAGASVLPISDSRVDHHRGYLPEREVGPFLAGASLMALPYTQASQSGVGSIAIGSGVPVVASRIGGLPDLVLDESYLAEPGDEQGLAEVLLRHLDDDLAVRRRVISELARPKSWDAVGKLALAEYERALRASP